MARIFGVTTNKIFDIYVSKIYGIGIVDVDTPEIDLGSLKGIGWLSGGKLLEDIKYVGNIVLKGIEEDYKVRHIINDKDVLYNIETGIDNDMAVICELETVYKPGYIQDISGLVGYVNKSYSNAIVINKNINKNVFIGELAGMVTLVGLVGKDVDNIVRTGSETLIAIGYVENN